MMFITKPVSVMRFGAMLYNKGFKIFLLSYHRDQLDEEFPPVIEDLVEDRIAS